jgi:hypothetical protein
VTAVGLAGLILGLLTALGAPVNAHSAANWYPLKWGAASLPAINYKFHTSVGSAFRNRVEDADARWDAVQPSAFTFNRLATDNPQPYSGSTVPCQNAPYAQEENVVYYRGISAFGETARCANAQGNIKWTLVSFDSTGQSWYTGTGSPGSNQIDAFHTATHEFGHFTGFSPHFTAQDTCNTTLPLNLATWQTMCDAVQILSPVGDELGETFRRTLETHDKHTFDGAY